MKNCDLGLENAALGLWPRAAFSRPWSQFLTVRTSQLANNIYIFLMDAISCGSINSKPAHLPYFTSTYKFLPIPCPTLKSCQMPNICLEWGRGVRGEVFSRFGILMEPLLFQIGHVQYINILAWVRGFWVKIANISCFSCTSISKRDLDTKKTTPNIVVWPESLGALLEYWWTLPIVLVFL